MTDKFDPNNYDMIDNTTKKRVELHSAVDRAFKAVELELDEAMAEILRLRGEIKEQGRKLALVELISLSAPFQDATRVGDDLLEALKDLPEPEDEEGEVSDDV